MELLKSIWPSLGHGYVGVQRNASYTKKGPGRRHDYITTAERARRAEEVRKAHEAAQAMNPA